MQESDRKRGHRAKAARKWRDQGAACTNAALSRREAAGVSAQPARLRPAAGAVARAVCAHASAPGSWPLRAARCRALRKPCRRLSRQTDVVTPIRAARGRHERDQACLVDTSACESWIWAMPGWLRSAPASRNSAGLTAGSYSPNSRPTAPAPCAVESEHLPEHARETFFRVHAELPCAGLGQCQTRRPNGRSP